MDRFWLISEDNWAFLTAQEASLGNLGVHITSSMSRGMTVYRGILEPPLAAYDLHVFVNQGAATYVAHLFALYRRLECLSCLLFVLCWSLVPSHQGLSSSSRQATREQSSKRATHVAAPCTFDWLGET